MSEDAGRSSANSQDQFLPRDGFLPPPRKRAMTSRAGAERDRQNQFHTYLRKQWGEQFPEGRQAKPNADGDSEMETGRTEPTAAGESPALLGAIRARIGVERDQREVDLTPRPGSERDVDIFLRGLSRVSEAGAGGDGDVDMGTAPVGLAALGESRDRIRAIKALAPTRTQPQTAPARRGPGREQDGDLPSASAAAGDGEGQKKRRARKRGQKSSGRRQREKRRRESLETGKRS